MKADAVKFCQFLGTPNVKFIIPVYQRNYDWKEEQCKQLFDDLENIIKKKLQKHFLGSIVVISHEDTVQVVSIDEFLIIDGQQRLTTISLLLLALYHSIGENDKKIQTNKKQLKNQYLINEFEKENEKIKLKPIKKDDFALKQIYEGNNDEFDENSNLTKNYLYFLERVNYSNHSIDEIYIAIQKLTIVQISLTKEDDPQLIFESLNSTGLSLSSADLIRNFILMSEPPRKQEQYYERYWVKLEKYTHFKVSDYIRDYLTFKERDIPNKDKVYFSFKKFVRDNFHKNNKEELLKELLRYAKVYETIVFSKSNNQNINQLLKNLNALDVKVSYPFLLEPV